MKVVAGGTHQPTVSLNCAPKFLGLLFLAMATLSRAEDFRWPIRANLLPPTAQGFAEYGDVSKSKYHTGIDIGVPIGTEVFPVADGEVVLIQKLSTTADHGYGNTVIMRHNSATGKSFVYSQYSHLSKIDDSLLDACKQKRRVDEVTLTCIAGVKWTSEDRIGKSGRSGHGVQEYPKYGEHLHLEIKSFGTLCTSDTGGIVCGYSTTPPWTIGYFDPIVRLNWAHVFPKSVPLIVTGDGVAVRFTPDASSNKRSITILNRTDTSVPLRGIAWSGGGPPCEIGGWIQVRRVDEPNCAGKLGPSTCFPDTRDPGLKAPDEYLGLIPTAWICASYLSPLKVSSAREAVTEWLLFSGGSVNETRVGAQGLSIELDERDGLFSVYQMARLGSDAVTDMWNLIFLDVLYNGTLYSGIADTHRDLGAALLLRYGATCTGAMALDAKTKCAVTALAKSRQIRMGSGRYDEGQRCVGWSDGKTECQPY